MSDLDRSAVFTYLLDVDPGFLELDARLGRERVTAVLQDWNAPENAEERDLYVFTQRWAAAHPIREV